MMKFLKRLHRAEEGTIMAEYVMTLPIFIVSFIGVMQLGMFSEMSVRTWAKAHRNTFELAVQTSKTRWSLLASPTAGGIAGGGSLLLGKPVHQTTVQRGLLIAADGATYTAMGLKGHWGESAVRSWPTDKVVKYRHIEGDVTRNSRDIIGNSKYAKDIVDESVGNFSGGGGGPLGAVNALISGTGLRPAIAAGQRYGVVFATASESMSVAGRRVGTKAHFNVTVPPFPLKGFEATGVPVGIARITMESQRQYSKMLGIKWSQPYPGGSLSVPSFNWPLQ